jgi:glutaredoxin 2
LDYAIQEATTYFEQKRDERITAFDDLNTTFQDAKKQYTDNLAEITRLEGEIEAGKTAGDDTSGLEADLATA